eukprot:5022932-Prymnesium_polylepis.1
MGGMPTSPVDAPRERSSLTILRWPHHAAMSSGVAPPASLTSSNGPVENETVLHLCSGLCPAWSRRCVAHAKRP